MPGLFHNLIKLCRFSKAESDNQQFPVQQVEYLGKAADVFVAMPYGVHASIPTDFLGLLVQLSEQEQNRAVIPLSPLERPHPLESGEIVFYHPVTGAKIHLKNNGDIEITANNTNYIGNIIITGNLTMTGDLTITGDVVTTGTIVNNTQNIGNTHIHSGVTAGGDVSGPVV